ncbi:hypothetical protein [Nocardia brasiliensis]
MLGFTSASRTPEAAFDRPKSGTDFDVRQVVGNDPSGRIIIYLNEIP